MRWLWLNFFLVLMALCLPQAGETMGTKPQYRVPFIYYLQHLDRAQLERINPEVAVIDPYDSGLTREDIAELQQRYGQRLIAYLSVGEVDPARRGEEDGYAFRPEWEHAGWLTRVPDALGTNEAWASRRVEYWDPEWQAILAERLVRLVEQGYDGVMFDTVDSFYSLRDHYRRDVRQDMAELVGHLRDVAKQKNPRFLIFINSGMELYDTSYSRTDEPFLALIDGQLKEDTWYNEQGKIEAEWTQDDLALLKRALAADKPVYSIDYFTNATVTMPNLEQMKDYRRKARAFGAVPFAADRSLGRYLPFNDRPE